MLAWLAIAAFAGTDPLADSPFPDLGFDDPPPGLVPARPPSGSVEVVLPALSGRVLLDGQAVDYAAGTDTFVAADVPAGPHHLRVTLNGRTRLDADVAVVAGVNLRCRDAATGMTCAGDGGAIDGTRASSSIDALSIANDPNAKQAAANGTYATPPPPSPEAEDEDQPKSTSDVVAKPVKIVPLHGGK